ncbi:MAG: ArsR/SmtB family transcription factor [Synechococcus sp.]
MTANSLQSPSVIAGFRALADPLRLQILETLRESELCVCDLCDRLQVNQSKLSFHLKSLREAGLVRARQEGRWMYYSLNLAQLVELEQYLSDYRRLATFQPAPRCC